MIRPQHTYGLSLVLCILGASLGGCTTQSDTSHAGPAASAPSVALTPAVTPASSGKLVLGAPIEAKAVVALSDVAKNPGAWSGKSFTTSGTVTAVCQHMGCWMEIKDEASEAHIKMAGHAFFVPKTASGHKAKVMGRLGPSEEMACGGEGHKGKGCKAEAEEQMGKPLAKLQFEATGVELLD